MSVEFTASRENHRRPRGYADWRPQAKTLALLEQVDEVLRQYREYLPLTVRQIFYRLVGAFGYEKTELGYNRLAEHLVRARRARILPFEAIRDDGVVTYSARWYAGIADFWDETAERMRDYQRDRQSGQAVRVELWCEAAGMMPQLARAADQYSVRVYSSGGFSSLTAVRMIADRALARSVPTVLLHVGDLDPSGESIFESMTADAAAFVRDDRMIHTLTINPVRVALTSEQVHEYDLPTAPPKPSDTRSRRWRGETCQLEALAPDDLAEIVEVAIQRELRMDTWGLQAAAEEADRLALFKGLPSGEEAP